MGVLKIALLVVAAALAINFVNEKLYSKLPVATSGTTDKEYSELQKLFRSNFELGWEKEGASFVVYKNGKKVVDLWGGYADKSAARLWQEDTMTVTFSTTKAVAAVCIAILADRGRLRYDDLVSKHWPAFANNGKGNITIQMALSHEGGLAYLDTPITFEMAKNPESIGKILEEQKPQWAPGSDSGYHAYTFGWLADQIIRHTDEKKRGIGEFLREEVTGPNGIDFHIGLAKTESYRVARVTVPTIWDRISELMNDARIYVYFTKLWKLMQDSPLYKTVNNPSWLKAVSQCTLNNPDYHELEQAAALGIGNARSLAHLFNLFTNEKIVSAATLDKLQFFYINKTDIIFGDIVAKGHGFLYLPTMREKQVPYVIGHTGHGCQQVIYDRKNKLVIAYTSNGLKTGLYDLCRTYWKLQQAVYDIIEKKQL